MKVHMINSVCGIKSIGRIELEWGRYANVREKIE